MFFLESNSYTLLCHVDCIKNEQYSRYWNGFCESDPIITKSSGIRWKKPTHTQNIFWNFFGAPKIFFLNQSCFWKKPAQSYWFENRNLPDSARKIIDFRASGTQNVSEPAQISFPTPETHSWPLRDVQWCPRSRVAKLLLQNQANFSFLAITTSWDFGAFFPKTTLI